MRPKYTMYITNRVNTFILYLCIHILTSARSQSDKSCMYVCGYVCVWVCMCVGFLHTCIEGVLHTCNVSVYLTYLIYKYI